MSKEQLQESDPPKTLDKKKKEYDLFADSSGDEEEERNKQEEDSVVQVTQGQGKSLVDQEGYYQPKTGEVMNEKYKVTEMAGKGVFSCVVRADVIESNQAENGVK